ncbi:MAG: type IV secretory system conjugative DNA transfer family protein, partial [Gemmatimonadales bacterium]
MTHAGTTARPWPAAAPIAGATQTVNGGLLAAPVTPDSGRAWLRNAMAALAVLAAAAAMVSWDAQYVMVRQVKHVPAIAALEAGIPDAGALIFAALGIALALHGRRALRARALNLASVAASVFMNVIAAAPGWRNLAIWAMPPVAYALASDTLIGVVRAWALARMQATGQNLAGDDIKAVAAKAEGIDEAAAARIEALEGNPVVDALLAAALAGRDLRQVARWVSGTRPEEAEEILSTTPGAAHYLADQLTEMRGEANKTISTVRMTMSRSLAFLADPALAVCVMAEEGQSLDIPSFLREAGTLYLIAETRGEDAPVAPLFACLAAEIHYTAALAGSLLPGGRLDPPLLMALDEVTQICPVPVPSWLADSGGKGIQIITVAHGEAQLRGRWGPDGARIIMDTSGAKIWLPGISDTTTLDAASALCGTTAMKESRNIVGRHYDRHDLYSRHPVMSPDMIRQLPGRYALLVRGGMSPVIARLPMAWTDRAYKKARRAGRASAVLGAAEPAGLFRDVPRPRRPWPADD